MTHSDNLDSAEAKIAEAKSTADGKSREKVLDDALAAIRAARKGSPVKVSLHFEADLDRETGARAGAAGTFQVRGLKDEHGNDAAHVVDQGRHFSSLNELKDAIASHITVSEA